MENIFDLFSMKGKTALITGASGALGGASAFALAAAGADVALIYNSHLQKAEALAERIKPYGGKIKLYKVNTMHVEEIRQNAEDVIADFGKLDVVVNIAGGNMDGAVYTGHKKTIFDLELQPQFDVITLNLFGGCIWPCLLYGAKMLKNPEGGSIINCSSTNGIRCLQGRTAYAAAKAGVINFTQSLAAHIAEDLNHKIRVNAVAPGFFPNFRASQMLYNEDGSLSPRAQNGVKATPMGRMGDPKELMGTILWLASDASSFVTGVTTPVDGGFLAYSPA